MKHALDVLKTCVSGMMMIVLFSIISMSVTCFADNRETVDPLTGKGALPIAQTDDRERSVVFKLQPSHVVMGFIASVAVLIAALSLKKYLSVKRELDQERLNLQKKNDQYRLLVENADEGILIVQNLKFTYVNKKVFDIMGLSRGSYNSKDLVDYILPEDLSIVLEHYDKTMLSKETENRFNVRLLKNDKSIVWVYLRIVPVVWDGEPAGLSFMRDVTEQKLLEKDLHQAQRLEALGVLSGGIAHDFNNILTTIIGNAQIALMDLSDHDPGKKEFEQIQESGYRARDLVRQILTISREHTMDVQPLYLSPIIKEALKLLRSSLPKNIKIIEKIDKQLSLIKADSIQMYQVFMNLCTNAKHAMEKQESPRLEVGLQNAAIRSIDPAVPDEPPPGRYVKLIVKDNGKGIDPKVAHNIFDPYFTTKGENEGTGLGLATTLGIVKQYGGHIFFKSEPGNGTCFRVYFPVVDVKQEEEKNHKATVPIQGKWKILFVDDEKEITCIAEKMLTSLGFSVMIANSGKQALEFFARDPEFFDLMVTDMAMPEMTGERLAKSVMQIRPEFPVILCTGHSDTLDERTAKKSGIVEYVVKPYNFKELSAKILKYIQHTQAA